MEYSYALLRLLWENALRRGEVVKADIKDFDSDSRSLTIYGKGQGTQAQRVSLRVVLQKLVEDRKL